MTNAPDTKRRDFASLNLQLTPYPLPLTTDD